MSDKRKTRTRTKRAASRPRLSPQGKRLVTALREVLDDVTGKRPLKMVAVVPDVINVRAVRHKTGLSQAAFAARFGINRRTLQDWEQGRYQPDAMARALLTIIGREPEAVRRALS
jgi:putative transcriptional regulator